MVKRIILWLLAVVSCFYFSPTEAQTLPRVTPEEAGMDSHRLTNADKVIQESIRKGDIPGAVLAVVRNGQMAYIKAYGNKQVYPDTVAMTTDAVFDLASCSKPLSTAVCVWILIERGKIRLDDPVSRYITGYRDYTDKQGQSTPIRIIDLLTHTSGLPAYGSTDELAKQYGSPNPDGLIAYISTCRRDFKPTTAFRYSCLNYITLQRIIETVSGESLRVFAQNNIFAPLGMMHTDYLPCRKDADGKWVNTDAAIWAKNDPDWNRLIVPTEKQPDSSVLSGQVHDPLARVMNGGISGNAGLFSSADDVAIEVAALMNGGEYNDRRILSPMAVKAMTSLPENATARFGRSPGWDMRSDYSSVNGSLFGKHTYGHTGYTGTSVVVDPDSRTAVILLTSRVHPKDKGSVVRLRALVANAVAAAVINR